MNTKAGQSYLFGPFRLDPTEHVLWEDDRPIVLPPKALATLTVLVENSGHLLTKDELMSAVWPGGCVEENNLAVNVSFLRKLFGGFECIETVPRAGYRFVAPVSVIGEGQGEAAEKAGPPPEVGDDRTAAVADGVPQRRWNDGPRAVRRLRLEMVVLVALVLAGSAFLATRFRTEPVAGLAPPVTLAVLPLENLSGDPAQEYFADGITDALIGELARVGVLRVISRTSAMTYKSERKPLPEIGRELGVRAVIEGTVLRAGERVRVRVQLIEAATDQHLWAESYDRDVSDLLNLQSEIAQTVAREVSAQIEPIEAVRRPAARQVNRRALDAFLQGSHYLNRLTRADVQEAIGWFQRSIGEDPGFAPAYAGLARCYNLLGKVMVAGMPQSEAGAKAAEAARKALEIDADLPEAHAVLAAVAHFDWQWVEAERRFRRALALNPSASATRSAYALYLATLGRAEEARSQIDEALRLDPLSMSLRWTAALITYEARRHDEAVESLGHLIEIAPEFEHAYWLLGLAYLARGMTPEAIDTLERARALHPDQLSILSVLGMAYGRAGRRAEAMGLLEELTRRAHNEYVPAGNFVDIHLGLGDHDGAFFWLEKAFEERSPYVTNLGVLPEVDSLRDDPRFKALLERMSLPAAPSRNTLAGSADR